MSAVDWQAARQAFPILQRRNYLASHALGPMPLAARADLAEYADSLELRLGGVPLHLERIEEVRGLVARLLGTDSSCVALCASATAAQASLGISIAARAMQLPALDRPRRRILVSQRSFPSSRFVWEGLGRLGFEIIYVETKSTCARDATALAALIDERVLVVAVPWVSPRTGALIEVAPLGLACREHGALLVLDAYQGVGSVPLDLSAERAGQLPSDARPHAVVGGVHKWLCGASMGLAFMYVDPAQANALLPAQPGWLGSADFPHFAEGFTPASGALRYQQGTPAVQPVFGARAGLRFLLDTGVSQLRRRSLDLTSELLGLAADAELKVLTPSAAALRGGTIALDVTQLGDSAQLRLLAALDQRGIDVDIRRGALRISPHPCMALSDCRHAVGAIRELMSKEI